MTKWPDNFMTQDWGDSIQDRVAKAIYDVQVQAARDQIDAFRFEMKGGQELAKRLLLETETAQVLIFFSFLDDRIQQLITFQLRQGQSKTEVGRLFGSNGPLGTFNNRVLLAFHLGWISNDVRSKLDAFRKIRNEFAHNAFKVKYADAALKPHIDALDFDRDDNGGSWRRSSVAVQRFALPTDNACDAHIQRFAGASRGKGLAGCS